MLFPSQQNNMVTSGRLSMLWVWTCRLATCAACVDVQACYVSCFCGCVDWYHDVMPDVTLWLAYLALSVIPARARLFGESVFFYDPCILPVCVSRKQTMANFDCESINMCEMHWYTRILEIKLPALGWAYEFGSLIARTSHRIPFPDPVCP